MLQQRHGRRSWGSFQPTVRWFKPIYPARQAYNPSAIASGCHSWGCLSAPSPFWVHAVFRNFTFCDYELRLVLGPIASADAAAKLCSTLGRFRLTCPDDLCRPAFDAGLKASLIGGPVVHDPYRHALVSICRGAQDARL